MKKTLIIILALAMIISLAACGQKTAEAPKQETQMEQPAPVEISLKIDTAEWPVIDGALACLPYYEQVAAVLMDLPLEDARQYVYGNNTPESFRELAEGRADLIFCGHASEEQTQYAKENNVIFEYTPYANDAFVFFVNKDNPVDSITKQQLHDIYAGKITNWKELGGEDLEIIAYQRNEGSGSQTGLYRYVIGSDEVINPPTERRIGDMGGIIDAVAGYDNAKGALGYSYLYFVTNQHFDDQIKLLKVDGYAPNEENIKAKNYPMLAEYCCVINKDEPADSTVRKIIDWCLSEQGQQLAKELYYVPVK